MITGTAGNFLRGRCPCWLKSARRSVSSRLMPSSVAIASAQTPWRDCGCLARSRRLPEPATRRHRHLFGATCDYEILDAACNLTDAFRRRESEGAEKAVRQQRARSEGCLWRETLQSRPSTALARGVRSANRARASRRLGYFYFNEEQHQGRAATLTAIRHRASSLSIPGAVVAVKGPGCEGSRGLVCTLPIQVEGPGPPRLGGVPCVRDN